MRHEVNYVLRAVHPKQESLVWVNNNAYLYPSILNFQEEHSSNSWNEANSFFYFLSELSEHNTAFLGYLLFNFFTDNSYRRKERLVMESIALCNSNCSLAEHVTILGFPTFSCIPMCSSPKRFSNVLIILLITLLPSKKPQYKLATSFPDSSPAAYTL